MEFQSKKIELIIKKIIALLKDSGEDYWLRYFNYNLDKLSKNDFDYQDIEKLNMVFKGGMGSFSDLVLHKNKKPLIDENNELEKLKDDLYEACKDAMKSDS